MPCFKASKNRLTLLLVVNAAGDFLVEASVHLPLQKSWTLKSYVESTLPVLYICNNKA